MLVCDKAEGLALQLCRCYIKMFCSIVCSQITGGSDEACGDATLAKVLSFCTGSEYPPPLGFDNPITVRFDSSTNWPLASTCALQLTYLQSFTTTLRSSRTMLCLGCSTMVVLDCCELFYSDCGT